MRLYQSTSVNAPRACDIALEVLRRKEVILTKSSAVSDGPRIEVARWEARSGPDSLGRPSGIQWAVERAGQLAGIRRSCVIEAEKRRKIDAGGVGTTCPERASGRDVRQTRGGMATLVETKQCGAIISPEEHGSWPFGLPVSLGSVILAWRFLPCVTLDSW